MGVIFIVAHACGKIAPAEVQEPKKDCSKRGLDTNEMVCLDTSTPKRKKRKVFLLSI